MAFKNIQLKVAFFLEESLAIVYISEEKEHYICKVIKWRPKAAYPAIYRRLVAIGDEDTAWIPACRIGHRDHAGVILIVDKNTRVQDMETSSRRSHRGTT